LGYQRVLLNGKEVGEIETRTALAGWYGTPVILLTGDQAAAKDLLEIVPQAETAVVKEGLGYYSCVSLSATAAQVLIEEKAGAAFRKIKEIPAYKIEGPVEIAVERTTRNTLYPLENLPAYITRVDPRTLLYKGKDFWEAWVRWQAD
jgi:D-amino peptidase